MNKVINARSSKAALGAFILFFMASNAHSACSGETRALVEKLLYKGFSGGNMDVIEQVFSADIRFEDPMFPPGLEGIKALVEQPAGINKWHGPYLKKKNIPADPWGNEYHYRSPGEEGQYGDLLRVE